MRDNSNQSEDSGKRKWEYLTRRGLMQTTALFGAGAIAGCSGDSGDEETTDGDGSSDGDGDGSSDGDGDGDGSSDGDGDGGSDGTPSGEFNNPVEERTDAQLVYASVGRSPPSQRNYNAYDPSSNAWGAFEGGGLLSVGFGITAPIPEDVYMTGGEDWVMADETTLEFTIRDDLYWHDGSQVTTEDIHTQMRLNEMVQRIGTPPEERGDDWAWSETIEDYEIVDETTYRYHLRDSYPDHVIKDTLAGTLNNFQFRVKKDIGYGDWAGRLEEDLESDRSTAEDTLNEFLNWQIPIEDIYGNGPFQYKDHTESEFLLEWFPDYPHADSNQFTEVKYQDFTSKTEALVQELAHFDNEWPYQDNVSDRLPPGYTFQEGIGGRIWQIAFNAGDFDSQYSQAPEDIYEPVTQDRLVRKAFAAATDRTQVDKAHPEYQAYPGPASQLHPDLKDRFDWIDELENYGVESDIEKATKYMEEAGYEQNDDGMWVDDDGETVSIQFMTDTANSQRLFMSQTVKQQMKDFGLQVEFRAVDGATYSSQRHEGKWDLIPDAGAFAPTPYKQAIYIPGVWGWFGNLYHISVEYEVPKEFGNPDSETETIDIESMKEEMATSRDEETLKQLVWAHNQNVPTIEQTYGRRGRWLNKRMWYVDGPEDLLQFTNGAYNFIFTIPDIQVSPRQGIDY